MHVLQISINKYRFWNNQYVALSDALNTFLFVWLNQQLLFFKLNRVALGAHHVIFFYFLGFFFCYVNQILLRIYGNYLMEKSEFTLKLYR